MKISYTKAKSDFPIYWEQIIAQRKPLYVQRRGYEDIVLLPADDFKSLYETAYLLNSPRNFQRLSEALNSSLQGQGKIQSITELKEEVGLGLAG